MATSFTYPTELPNPNVNFSVSKRGNLITTRFASGRRRQHDAFNDKRRQAKVTIEVNQANFAIFQQWWIETLTNGASNFMMDLYLDTPDYQPYEVTPLEGTYRAKHFGVGWWKITFDILILDQLY